MLSHTLMLCVIEPKWWSWKLSKNHRVQPFHFLKINSMEVICIQKNTFNLSVVWVLCILTNMFTVWPPRLYYRTLSSPQKFPVCPFPVNSTHHSGPRDSWFFFFFLFSFLNLWLHHVACEVLVLHSGIKHTRPALAEKSLKHWVARKVPRLLIFFWIALELLGLF